MMKLLVMDFSVGVPLPRMQMLDGFNEGWIDFERVGTESRRGGVELATVVEKLVAPAEACSTYESRCSQRSAS